MILEMQLVLVYALSVIFMLVVQSYFATRQHGIKTLLEYKEHITLTGIAGRSDRAVKNSIVSLVLVLPEVRAGWNRQKRVPKIGMCPQARQRLSQ